MIDYLDRSRAITVRPSSRVQHIDIAKGICISLVALGHSDLEKFIPGINNSMSLFRMPLFFFLSGVFFSATSVTAKTFILKKADALLKPYFVSIFIAIFLLYFLSSQTEPLSQQLFGVVYGNGKNAPLESMWFLTHLFAIYGFAYFVFKVTEIHQRKLVLQLTFTTAMLVLGIYCIDFFWQARLKLGNNIITLPGLPYSIDIILISASFFMMGAFLKKWVILLKPNIYLLFFALAILVAITFFSSAYIDLHERFINLPLLSVIGAVCGIYIILIVSYLISLNANSLPNHLFLLLGQASLFILIFHSFVGARFYEILIKTRIEELYPLFAVIAFFASLALPLLIKHAVSKSSILSKLYFPVAGRI